MFKYVVCWLIIILSTSAFLIKGIGKADRVLMFTGIGIIFFLLILHVVYDSGNHMHIYFKNQFVIIILGVAGSVLMADVFHAQNFSITLYQQRAVYYYFFYFLLHYLLPNPRRLEKMIVIYAILFCIFYIIQVIVYPTLITESRVFLDRDTLRIFMPGEIIMIVAYFISFDRIFQKFEWHYLILLILSLIVVLLLGTRQILFSLLVLSFFNILINKRIKNKIAILVLFIGVMFTSYLIMRETIDEMIDLTLKHREEGDSYIRLRAIDYFTKEFPVNRLVKIFGNGEPSERSAYGVKLSKVSKSFGFYLSDIGIFALLVKYGILFVIGCVLLWFKAMVFHLHRNISYIKYLMFYLLFTSTTTQLPFENAEGIATLCIVFYSIDYYKHKERIRFDSQQNKNLTSPVKEEL